MSSGLFSTPPSFAAHRRSLTVNSTGMELSDLNASAVPVSTGSTAGLSPTTELAPARSPGIYTIPQRSAAPAPPPTPAVGWRSAAPKPLQLGSKSSSPALLAPMTAPPGGRLAYAAAARGISLDLRPRSAKPRSARRWPGPASPLSATTSPRTRGLTVGVLNGSELVAESAPVTPGLLAPNGTQSALATAVPAPMRSPEAPTQTQAQGGLTPRRGVRDIILCRYYHTPGMTCTSSPCRFVHDLETLNLGTRTAPVSPLVPHSSRERDLTRGTFALAQATAPLPVEGGGPVGVLKIGTANIVPGERVAVVDASGVEVTGAAFKMSGGGKGPAGKCRAKFKTVPCKEYAAGECAYGDYCSFIHDPENLYDEGKHAKVKVKKQESPATDALLTPVDVDVHMALPPGFTFQYEQCPPHASQGLAPAYIPTTPQYAPQMLPATPPAPLLSTLDLSPGESDISDPAGAWDPARLRSFSDVEPLNFDPIYYSMPPGQYPVPEFYPPPYGYGLPMSAPAFQTHYTEWNGPLSASVGGSPPRVKRAYYRTRPCRFYAQDHCPHGENCTYLHIKPSELKKNPALRASIPCKWFNSGQGCQTPACAYAHTAVEAPPTPRNYRTRPCRHFAVGRCHLGDKCNFSHDGMLETVKEQAGAHSPMYPQEGAHALTEERLAAACAELRAKMRVEKSVAESDDESDDDDLEIITVATMTASHATGSVKSGAVSV